MPGTLVVAPLGALGDDPRRLLEVRGQRRGAQLVDPRRRLADPARREAELGGRAPDRARVGRRGDEEDRVALGALEALHLAGHVLVADLELLRVDDLEAELLGREVDARLAGLAVGVVLDERADVLALAVGLVDVVVERVDRLDLVGPADRQQVRLAHPEGVERRGRRDDLVLHELRQGGERGRGAEHLRERHDVVLDLVVLLDGGRRRVLRVLLDQLDLVLAGDAALRVDVVEVDLVAGRQRLADHRHRAGQRRQHPELDRLAVEAGGVRQRRVPRLAGVTLVVGGASAPGEHQRQQRDDPEHPLHVSLLSRRTAMP